MPAPAACQSRPRPPSEAGVMAANDLSRRAFLARIGVLGASATLLPQCAGPDASATAVSELGLGALVDLLRPVLGQLARDTLNGFVVFVVPGQAVRVPDA